MLKNLEVDLVKEETPLTPKQEKFVKEFVANDGMITKRQAAINAGYPEKSAHVKASELTNPNMHPNVVAAIKAYRAELDEKYGITFARHIRDMQRIRDLAIENGAYSAAVRLSIAGGRLREIFTSINLKSDTGRLTACLVKKLKRQQELKDQHGHDIINITPEEEKSGVELLSEISETPEEASA